MTDSEKPIFAISTSMQTSALHLHRISGQGIFNKIEPFLKKKNKSFLFSYHNNFPSTHYAILYDTQNNIIDDIIITFYKSPKSYTGEDLIEISCHGNPIISHNLHTFLRGIGCRDALEGEFTQRAFLNGKFDLSQAEAIRELIHAETNVGIDLSRNQLNGALTAEIFALKEKFIGLLSYFEAHIDFAADEVGDYKPEDILPNLELILSRLLTLKNSYQRGIKLKSGLRVVLCGRPNSGKSTLYNTLLQSERAIVTDIAGTTRDVLTERFQIGKRDFVLMDTAGIRTTKNKVEHLGVKKSLQTLYEADVICVLLDMTKPFSQSLRMIKDYLTEFLMTKKLVFVISKKDLLLSNKIDNAVSRIKNEFKDEYIVSVSCHDISNLIECFKELYDEKILSEKNKFCDSPVLLSTRSHDKIQEAMELLNQTKQDIKDHDFPEKIASNLYVSLKILEEILGDLDMDSIYKNIFSTFCIGK